MAHKRYTLATLKKAALLGELECLYSSWLTDSYGHDAAEAAANENNGWLPFVLSEDKTTPIHVKRDDDGKPVAVVAGAEMLRKPHLYLSTCKDPDGVERCYIKVHALPMWIDAQVRYAHKTIAEYVGTYYIDDEQMKKHYYTQPMSSDTNSKKHYRELNGKVVEWNSPVATES